MHKNQKQSSFYVRYVLLLGVLFLLGSCLEDTSCGKNTESGLLFTFYEVSELEGGRLVRKNNDGVAVFEYGNYEDTVYAYSSDDTLRMIPLQLNDTITDYVFRKDSVEDRVQFHHTLPVADFLDVNCGFAPNYQLTSGSFTNTFIDSIYIVYPEVSTDVFTTNVYIFY